MYYLQTRYYDPELGRFISADSIEYLDPETVGGLNLYAYCGNNPVMAIDPEGTFLIALLIGIFAVAGAVAVGTITYNAAKDAGYSGWELAGLTILGAIGGGLIGGFVGAGIGFGLGLAATGASMLGTGLGGMSLALANGMAIGAAGTMVAAGVGTIVVGGAIAIGSAALGINILFMGKGSGPRMGHNQYEKKTWNEAMRRLGITNQDLMKRIHAKLKKYPYAETLDDLIKTIKKILDTIKYKKK